MVALLAALPGCGGLASATPGGADASADVTGMTRPDSSAMPEEGADASTGCVGLVCDASGEPVVFSSCPTTPPPIGAKCTNEGEICEYGPSWWLACNEELRCTSGTWQKNNVFGPGPCGELDAAGSCPATWAEASALDAGGFTCPALDCQYAEGYCECVSNCGGGGQVHPLVPGTWLCQPATAGCPSPRPHLGTTCDEAGAQCQYGWPCGCGQQLACGEGVWRGNPIPPCP
jgi:hypothetical protein